VTIMRGLRWMRRLMDVTVKYACDPATRFEVGVWECENGHREIGDPVRLRNGMEGPGMHPYRGPNVGPGGRCARCDEPLHLAEISHLHRIP